MRLASPDRRLPPVTLHDALWWLLAATLAVLGAQLVWTLLTPVSPLGDWRPASVRLMSPAARSALFAGFDPFNRGIAVPQVAGPPTVTSLAVTLFGVRINAATGGGSAIIAGSDGVQEVYRIGAEIEPGVTLAGVHFDHVVLSRNGATELLYLDQSKPAPAVAAAPAAAGGAVPSVLPPPAGPPTAEALKQGVSFQPRAENGKVIGFDVSATGDGSAFRSIGLQPGDVVTAIAGKPVAGAADAASLVGALAPGASIPVTVRRNGQQLPLAITVAR